MKQGKFDTDTAKGLVVRASDEPDDIIECYIEELYITNDGEFFSYRQDWKKEKGGNGFPVETDSIVACSRERAKTILESVLNKEISMAKIHKDALKDIYTDGLEKIQGNNKFELDIETINKLPVETTIEEVKEIIVEINPIINVDFAFVLCEVQAEIEEEKEMDSPFPINIIYRLHKENEKCWKILVLSQCAGRYIVEDEMCLNIDEENLEECLKQQAVNSYMNDEMKFQQLFRDQLALLEKQRE